MLVSLIPDNWQFIIPFFIFIYLAIHGNHEVKQSGNPVLLNIKFLIFQQHAATTPTSSGGEK